MQVVLHFVIVLLSEVVFVPFELLEQQQTPTFLEVNDRSHLLQDGVEFQIYFLKGQDLIRILLVVTVVVALALSVAEGVRHFDGRLLILTALVLRIVVVGVIVVLVIVFLLHISN